MTNLRGQIIGDEVTRQQAYDSHVLDYSFTESSFKC